VKKPAIAAAFGVAVAVAGAAFAQNAAAPAGTTLEQTAPGSNPAAPAGLGDLEKTTFACPRAALNAAAREVAKHPSQGTYQFSHFNIVSASHHAAYEVHFTSNYTEEPVLKFCVAVYCQQGFDPSTTTSVKLIGAKPAPHAAGAGHGPDACAPKRAPARRPTAR
jgi:hypothetical protein